MTQNPDASANPWYLAVDLSDSVEEVVLSGNVAGLIRLRDILSALIENPIPGQHHHLDDFTGLSGNIRHLVVQISPHRPEPPGE